MLGYLSSLIQTLSQQFFSRKSAGTHAETQGLGRILGFATAIAGMLIFALMIGVVSESIGASVDSLKKGTAKVISLLLS